MIKFDVGVDIGTTNTKISFKDGKNNLTMPSVVAIKKSTKQIVGVGKKAYDMLGKAPDTIIVKKTMSKGVVSDFSLNKLMLKETLLKKLNRNFKKPKICVCFHSFMTNLEKLVFKNSIFSSESDNIYLIDESLASGIGAGLDLSNRSSFFVVNIGGGTTDIAVICSGGVIMNSSVQIGAELIDEIICKNLLNDHQLLIGKATAERLKKRAVTVSNPSETLKYKVKGKDLLTGLPKTIELSQKQICKNTIIPIEKIIDNIFDVVKQVSSDVVSDIQKNGIVLTGGGSLILGIREFISKRMNINVNIVKNPIDCASIGALNASNILNDRLFQFVLPA